MFTSIYTVCDEKTFSDLLSKAEIIEEDGHGLKVLLLENGNYLKLFRIKHLVSSARIYNPAKRFRDNAKKLAAFGIDTVRVTQLYSIPHLQRWGAEYEPLQGEVLSAIIEQGTFNEERQTSLVDFVLALHEQGIYFRSLHAGNIVLTPTQHWGLIDILDCRFGRGELPKGKRQRNLQHLFRYENIKPFRKKIEQLYWNTKVQATTTR
ncbi:MAG: toluene tolerance protein [Pseudomonadales bacterium]|nr:toluene tolerance protein [Pseudomonadales bacterium]